MPLFTDLGVFRSSQNNILPLEGKFLLSASNDKAAQLWDTETDKAIELFGVRDPINGSSSSILVYIS